MKAVTPEQSVVKVGVQMDGTVPLRGLTQLQRGEYEITLSTSGVKLTRHTWGFVGESPQNPQTETRLFGLADLVQTLAANMPSRCLTCNRELRRDEADICHDCHTVRRGGSKGSDDDTDTNERADASPEPAGAAVDV